MLVESNIDKAKKDSLAHSSFIEDFFRPLFLILNIHGFTFQRIYKNEERIFLSNSVNWIENSFEKKFFLAQSYKTYRFKPEYMLWAQWPKDDNEAINLIRDAHNNFNYGNALSITRPKEDYVDIYALRGYANDFEVNFRYFPYLDTINKYLDYFLFQINHSLSKIEIFKMDREIDKEANCDIESTKLSPELSFVIGNKLIHPITGTPFLTNREEECLKELVIGKSSKEIAKQLSISYRTVEQHITNIKLKLKASSRSDLIEKLIKIEFNKRLLFSQIIKN